MPARFYKAYLSEAGGRCLGVLSTDSGVGVANVLSELCHALADGSAKLTRFESSAHPFRSLQTTGWTWRCQDYGPRRPSAGDKVP